VKLLPIPLLFVAAAFVFVPDLRTAYFWTHMLNNEIRPALDLLEVAVGHLVRW